KIGNDFHKVEQDLQKAPMPGSTPPGQPGPGQPPAAPPARPPEAPPPARPAADPLAAIGLAEGRADADRQAPRASYERVAARHGQETARAVILAAADVLRGDAA